MFAPDELAYRSLRAELALLLSMSEYQAERLMDLAYRTVYEYQKLLPALASGAITRQHAQVICDAGLLIGASNEPSVRERRAGYEAAVLKIAAVETPNRLLPLARRLAETWVETPIETRHQRARSERRVTVTDAEDGMADLIAHLPAPEAYAIRDRLTRIAKSAKQGHRVVRLPSSPDSSETEDHTHDPRTRDQLRADALVDLLLSSDPFALASNSSLQQTSSKQRQRQRQQQRQQQVSRVCPLSLRVTVRSTSRPSDASPPSLRISRSSKPTRSPAR